MQKPQKQGQIDQTHATRTASLVRAGLMKPNELSPLKNALRSQAQRGDIGKLPRNQRDILSKYYSAVNNSALGSNQSVNVIKRNINAGYEITRDDYICEASSSAVDPPAMLVLKRKAIRIFPDGKRVALYTNDPFGLSFAVPYNANGIDKNVVVMKTEEVEQQEDTITENIDHIANIVKTKQAKRLKFDNGATAHVDGYTASAVHQVYQAVNDENKKKIARMVKHSPEQLGKVAAFGFKHAKK